MLMKVKIFLYLLRNNNLFSDRSVATALALKMFLVIKCPQWMRKPVTIIMTATMATRVTATEA